MTDMYVGRTFKAKEGWSKYRCVARDRDGAYILRSLRSPDRIIAIREIDLITKWKVIA